MILTLGWTSRPQLDVVGPSPEAGVVQLSPEDSWGSAVCTDPPASQRDMRLTEPIPLESVTLCDLEVRPQDGGGADRGDPLTITATDPGAAALLRQIADEWSQPDTSPPWWWPQTCTSEVVMPDTSFVVTTTAGNTLSLRPPIDSCGQPRNGTTVRQLQLLAASDQDR